MKLIELWKPVFMLSLLLSSCSNDEVGNWDSMEWKVENLSPQDISYNKRTQEIKVNSKGGSINIICKNYSGFWFSMPLESLEPAFQDYKGEWYDLSIRKNVMTCKFKENESTANDTLRVVVTAGDIFSHFTIIRTSP